MENLNHDFFVAGGARQVGTLLILLVIVLSLCACQPQGPLAQKGVLDLRAWDAGRDGPLALDGAWEFAWDALLGPDGQHANAAVLGCMVQAPGAWNRSPGLEALFPGRGCATYRLTLLLPKDRTALSLLIPAISSAVRVYGNDRLLFARGAPGATAALEVPASGAGLADIPLALGVDELKMVVLVSNFAMLEGGLQKSLILGRQEDIQALWMRERVLYGAGIAVLAVAGLLCWGMAGLRRPDKDLLLAGLFCVLLALSALGSGPRVILQLMPGLGFRMVLALQLIPWLASLPVAAAILQVRYPAQASRAFLAFLGGLSLLGALVVLFAPLSWCGFLINPLIFLSVMTACYGLYTLIRVARS